MTGAVDFPKRLDPACRGSSSIRASVHRKRTHTAQPRAQIYHWQQVSEPHIQQWTPLVQPQNIYNLSKQSSGREKQTVSSGS